MTSWQEKLYPNLPIFAQNIACNVHGYSQRKLRYGGDFQELLVWLEETQWWSQQDIQDYQSEKLQEIVRHAYETVPYYRHKFDECRVKPADIKSVSDLPKLPLLTKEDVRLHYKEMVSSKFRPDDLVFSHTSGTTGKSLQFYLEPAAFKFRWAVWWRYRQRFGIQFDAPYATFTGLTAVPVNQSKPPYWRVNHVMKQTIFTMHHIVPDKIKSITDKLNHGGFEYYSGYPSILYVLASLIRENGLKITAPPKVIFTGAENLYDHHRQLISEVFDCPVTDEYGFSEGCGNASRCADDLFHEDFEYGILECGEPEPIEEHKIRGKIIATGFASYGMPFIRYDVGDVGTWRLGKCSCGRQTKTLSRINGRIEDYVITPEGRKIMRFDYIFKDTHNIRDVQVVQRELQSICLRIVRRSSYSSRDEDILINEIKTRISPKLKTIFEYIDEIEPEPNGKIRAVKSFISQNQINEVQP